MQKTPRTILLATLIGIGVSSCGEADKQDKKNPSDQELACNLIYIPELVKAKVFFPNSKIQPVTLKAIAPDAREIVMEPSGNYGLREKDTSGAIKHGLAKSFLFEKPLLGTNTYQIVLTNPADNKEIERKSVEVTLTRDRCGHGTVTTLENVQFNLDSPVDAQLDPSKEYLPLDDGSILVVDPSTKTASKLGTNQTYTEIEVVRVFNLEYQTAKTFGVQVHEERVVSNKIKLGEFTEIGIDRGPLPTPTIDTPEGMITIEAKNVKDTQIRIVYGKESK